MACFSSRTLERTSARTRCGYAGEDEEDKEDDDVEIGVVECESGAAGGGSEHCNMPPNG